MNERVWDASKVAETISHSPQQFHRLLTRPDLERDSPGPSYRGEWPPRRVSEKSKMPDIDSSC